MSRHVPVVNLLSAAANPLTSQHHFVSESKDAIAKDHDMGFNDFLGKSNLPRFDEMLPPPQLGPSFVSVTLTYSY